MKDARKARWVLAAMAVLVVPAFWSVRQIHLENNIGKWLPAGDRQAQTLRWYPDHFPQENRILISWDGSSLQDPRIGKLAGRLAGLDRITNVLTPHEIIQRMVAAGVDRDEAYRRLQGVLIGSGPDAPAALSITLSETGRADKTGTIRAIRRAAEEVGIEKSALHLGGESLVGVALNHSVVDAAWNPDVPAWALHKRSVLLLSAVVGVLLAVILLRSLRLATMVLFAAFYTTLLAVALVPVTGGSMNMVLVVMPPLLVVLTISAAIHIANYFKHAADKNPATAALQARKLGTVPCALASLTTAVGLLSLTTSSLTPVRDFGLYSAVGCLIGLAVVLWGFPALLQFWPPFLTGKRGRGLPFSGRPLAGARGESPPRNGSPAPAVWHNWGGLISRHRMTVTIAFLALFCVGLLGLRWFRTEIRVIRNFPDDSRIVQDFQFLEEHVAGVVPVEMVVRFERDAQDQLHFLKRQEVVRKLEERMRAHPDVSGTMSLADFWPMYTPTAEDADRLIRILDAKKANEIENAVEEGASAKAFLTTPAEAGVLNKSGDELWRITAYVGLVSDVDYADVIRDLHRLAGSVLKGHPGTGHVVTGMVPVFERAQQAVLESLIRSFVLAFAVIAVVMMIVLKHPLAGMMAMLPNLFPIGFIFGLISWFGLWVDIGMMITAAIALGIAVDGTLHLLIWFREEIAHGLGRQEAVTQALGHCGPAMWQTSIVVALGMLMLSFSDLLLISRFGWLMAALIAMALVADLVFLPALLAGPLGALMQKRQAASAPGKSDPIHAVGRFESRHSKPAPTGHPPDGARPVLQEGET